MDSLCFDRGASWLSPQPGTWTFCLHQRCYSRWEHESAWADMCHCFLKEQNPRLYIHPEPNTALPRFFSAWNRGQAALLGCQVSQVTLTINDWTKLLRAATLCFCQGEEALLPVCGIRVKAGIGIRRCTLVDVEILHKIWYKHFHASFWRVDLSSQIGNKFRIKKLSNSFYKAIP